MILIEVNREMHVFSIPRRNMDATGEGVSRPSGKSGSWSSMAASESTSTPPDIHQEAAIIMLTHLDCSYLQFSRGPGGSFMSERAF